MAPPLSHRLAAAVLLAAAAAAKLVTVRNDVPRLDVNGDIIDCHSGNIIAVNGLFYMVGEHYGNSSGMGPSPPLLFPKIVVYTSPDFAAWTFRGFAINDWPTKVRRRARANTAAGHPDLAIRRGDGARERR